MYTPAAVLRYCITCIAVTQYLRTMGPARQTGCCPTRGVPVMQEPTAGYVPRGGGRDVQGEWWPCNGVSAGCGDYLGCFREGIEEGKGGCFSGITMWMLLRLAGRVMVCDWRYSGRGQEGLFVGEVRFRGLLLRVLTVNCGVGL